MKNYVSPEIHLEKFNTFEPIASLSDWLVTQGGAYDNASIVSYEITS